MKNKKAQISIFIAIGILLLIGGLVFVVFKYSEGDLEAGVEEVVVEIPVEFQPINDFIESCIAKVGKEGIKQIGYHGGYVDLKEYGMIPEAGNPTEGRAFLFNPKDLNSGVAYWHYFKSDNECETDCFCGSEQPFLHEEDGAPSIERQLRKYVDDNLAACLDGFKSFKGVGFEIIEESKIETKVYIREKDVLLYVNYKIIMNLGIFLVFINTIYMNEIIIILFHILGKNYLVVIYKDKYLNSNYIY